MFLMCLLFAGFASADSFWWTDCTARKEILEHKGYHGDMADIWSAGVVLFIMVLTLSCQHCVKHCHLT